MLIMEKIDNNGSLRQRFCDFDMGVMVFCIRKQFKGDLCDR